MEYPSVRGYLSASGCDWAARGGEADPSWIPLLLVPVIELQRLEESDQRLLVFGHQL